MSVDFVTCEDQPVHRTVSSAPLFLEQNINHFVGARSGPKLSAKLVCHSLFGEGGGGAPRPHPGSGTANSISRRQRDRVMVHGHVDIKEADYQTTCCCCFKTWVARGALAHESGLSTQNIIA